MEKRPNRRDRSDSRESPQAWSRRRVHRQPSPPSSIHNTGTSLGRTRIDRQGPQPAEKHPNNRKGRPRQSAESIVRFDNLEPKGQPLLSVSKDPPQLKHDSADWRRRSASPTSSTMLDPAAIPHQRVCDPGGGRKQEKCLSASVPSRHNGQTKRSVEIGEDNRVTVRLHRHTPSTEARTTQDKRFVDLREYGENAARARQARPQVANSDLDRRLKSRDPRLVRKAEVQARKSDGSLSRRERRLSPSDDETPPVSGKPPQLPPAAEREDLWEEPQSRSSGERQLRKDYPSPGGGHPRGDVVKVTQAPALYRKPPKALGAGLERTGSGLARISSDSAPTDPRRQRVPRTFPRGGSTRCAASHTVPSTKSTGSFVSEDNQSFTPSDGEASVAGSPNIRSGGIEPRRLSPGDDVRTEGDGGRQFVKNEPPAYTQGRGEGIKPASAGFACHSPHTLRQKDRVCSDTGGEGKTFRPELGQYGVKRAHRLDGDDGASRNNEGIVMRRQLALSIEGVTLGGTGVQPRHSPPSVEGLQGVHVRLPLQGHHTPPIAHELPLKGSATLPLHRESSPSHPEQPRFRPTPRPLQPEPPRHQPERPSFYRGPPTSHRDPQLIHREPPPFHREPTSIHREPTSIHREQTSIHREPTSIHREPTSIHREPTSIHREPPQIKHEPQPIRYEPPLVRREPPPRHIEMGLPPGQGMRSLHCDPSPLRDRRNPGSPPGLQNIPRAVGPANQSARMLPEQCPRLNNRVSSEQFRAHGMNEGYDCDGSQLRSQHPQTDRSHGRMVPPPSSSAASLPFAEDDGQRRSAYAQAMHNKRFMRCAPEEKAVRNPAQLEVGRRGLGTPASGIESAATSFGPPNAPVHLPQHIPQRGYPQESRFQGPPPAVQWDDGFRGNLSGSHVGDHGDNFDRGAPVETYSRQPWDSYSDDDDAEFPLEHTSPEWTPACAVKRPEQGTTPANPSSDHDPVEKNIGETMAAESIEGERSNDDGDDNENDNDYDNDNDYENDNDYDNENDNENGGNVIEVEKSKASEEASIGDSHDSRERLDEPSGDVPHMTPEVARDSSITADVQNGAQPTVGSCAADVIVKDPARKRRRLEPTPLAQVAWGVGDLNRFPRLDIPDNLTHVVASWAALDTRAIGVIPMICQPMVRESVEDKGGEEKISSKGKRKRVDGGSTAEVDQVERGISRGRTWSSRVLVPFGLIPERAAEGCWAEALRLVVATSNPGALPPEAGVDGGGEEESGNGVAVGGKRRASGGRLFTLPGGLWDAELDGGDPEEDDNKALIGTAVRACRSSAGVDLSGCSHWLKFCELHEDDRVTVVFLCGGGVRAVEGASEDLCVATIADLIQGGGTSGEDNLGENQSASDATFEARLGAEFLWGLVSRDWAALMLDCLRLYAKAPDGETDRAVTSSDDAAAAADPTGRREKLPQVDRQGQGGQDICEMVETPAEIRAAFGLYDMEGEGCVSGEHLETWLFDAGFRLSARYLTSLLRSLCKATEDGKRLLFEYRRRLGKWGTETHDAGSGGSAPPQPQPPELNKAVQAANGVDVSVAASGSPPTVDESARATENSDASDGGET